MSAALANIVVMQAIAAILAAVMLVAWRSFDRPRHAFIWALSFGIAALAWFIVFVTLAFNLNVHVMEMLTGGLGCLCKALLAIGFIQRARNKVNTTPLFLAVGTAAAFLALVTVVIPLPGASDAIWLSFGATMLTISAAHVSRSIRTASLVERATAVMLLLFAAVDFTGAAFALYQGANGDGSGVQLFRLILMLFHPPAFVGVEVFTVFLVAVDLAERMRSLAVSDLLTGIPNRRGFEEAAERAIRNAQRQRQPLTLVVTDIDRFKAINDRHGHAAGDRAIQHFARRIERMVRRGDLIGRIGGEEFALLLINTRSIEAVEVVERIRRDVSAVPVDGPETILMTASFGVTDLRPGDTTLANLFARADRALYRAKMDGRDRIACVELMESPPQSQDSMWATSTPM